MVYTCNPVQTTDKNCSCIKYYCIDIKIDISWFYFMRNLSLVPYISGI